MMHLIAQAALFLFGLLVFLAVFSDRIPPVKKWANTIPGGSADASPAPAAPQEGAHGCYVEPDHVRIKREAYAKRRQNRVRKEIDALVGDEVYEGNADA